LTAIAVNSFAGMVPRTSKRLLQDSQAQIASGARLTSGVLVPLHDCKTIYLPVIDTVAMHRIYNGTDEYFLTWDVDVDAVRGPIAGDTTYRTYYTGDNEPRVTNLAMATGAAPYPDDFYVLGVFPPATAPGASHAGGVGAAISRAFVYTFVTQWGEESQPSPASAVTTGKVDGTWTVNSMDVAPANTFATTGGSWASGIATITVASTFGLRVGEEISVSGVSPAGYNTASAVITELAAGSIKYAVTSDPGAYASAGTVTKTAPHNTTSMMKNIYWTETTASGTEYQYVKQVSVATTSTTVAGNTVAGEVLPSTDWPMPPVGLRGLCQHPSGAMVGFDGNQLCFSEVYKPYAWPNAYRDTTNHKIVGLGVFGTSVLVATEGIPYVSSGVDPSTMSLTKVDQPWPCLSKRGIVSLGFGVVYPCPQGLALIGSTGSSLATEGLYTLEEWREINPETIIAAAYGGRYVFSYDPGSGIRQMIVIDKAEFASVVAVNKRADALYGDPSNGKLYLVIDNEIVEWDSEDSPFISFDWMSKLFVVPKPMNLGAAKVDADFTLSESEQAALDAAVEAAIAANEALVASGDYEVASAMTDLGELEIGGVDLPDIPSGSADQLLFMLYVGDTLKFTKQVRSDRAFALPAGFKSDKYAIRLAGTVKVNAAKCAETFRELEKV